MRAGQREVRPHIMIESPVRPVRGVVTLVAFLTECIVVRVIVFVAGEAVAWRILVFLGLMAIRAGNGLVLAKKRKRIKVVVEFDPFRP